MSDAGPAHSTGPGCDRGLAAVQDRSVDKRQPAVHNHSGGQRTSRSSARAWDVGRGFPAKKMLSSSRRSSVSARHAAASYSQTFLNQNDLPIVMTDLACRGDEPNLDSCAKNVANLTLCNRAQSIGVKCFEVDYTARLTSSSNPTGSGTTEGRLEVWLTTGQVMRTARQPCVLPYASLPASW